MATWIIKVYEALCQTEIFEINGKEADSRDFGSHFDHDSENAEEYGCGDMQFEIEFSVEEVVAKYDITQDECQQIAEELRDKLSFGCCGWCI